MTKDLITPDLLEKAADSATIEQLNTVIKARDIEITALKAQVNALREALNPRVIDLVRCGIGANYGGECYINELSKTLQPIKDLANKTPQQCLAEYREQLFSDLIERYGEYSEYSPSLLIINENDIIQFLEELKND